MDEDIFFDWIRQNLIDLISRELTDLDSARAQATIWIRFRIEYEDRIIDRVRLPFNSRMTDIFQGSDFNEIVDGMFTHMKTQKTQHGQIADLYSMRFYLWTLASIS